MAFKRPQKQPKIIFIISGKKATGKDLLGTYLRYYGFIRVAFADALKRMVRQLFKLTVEQTDGALKEHPTKYIRPGGKMVTPRRIMIEVGQFFRSFDPDWWVTQAIELINGNDAGSRIYIPDARFPNEIVRLKELKDAVVVTIRLNRSISERNKIYPGCENDKDTSETALDSYGHFDYALEAEKNHTPQDLERFAAKVVDDVTQSLSIH